jgi:hypothetical protein
MTVTSSPHHPKPLAVLAIPRVASRAKTLLRFDANIGKYTSLAYLAAEKETF